MARKLKTKLHFNRVSMQRNDPRVWSAHTSKSCNQSEKVVVRHNGEIVLETVFNPTAKQPRAYLQMFGVVSYEDGVTVVDV
jgi:hypothetical protein